MKNTVTKANCCTVLHCYLEDLNQESSVWKYTKWKKYQESSGFEPASFRKDDHDATTELQDIVNIGSNTTV